MAADRYRSAAVELLVGRALYERVVAERLASARESIAIATANVKAMFVERGGRYESVVEVFAELARRGVEIRLLHAELPSRPFRAAFDRRRELVSGGLSLKICPRVHFKAVIVDGAWLYLGSANLTGAGLGAKSEGRRNFEIGIATEDFELLDRTSSLFEAIWSGAECGSCQLREACPDPLGPAAAGGLRAGGRRRRAAAGVQLGRPRRLRR